jgi:hypothetical protein
MRCPILIKRPRGDCKGELPIVCRGDRKELLIVNVLDFGADPTGAANSWQAFKDWSTAISTAGGGIGVVPAGMYTIDQVSDADGNQDFKFEGCNGLSLVGYGATLNLKGNVHLPLLPGGATDKHMVCPFFIHNCVNVCVEGFEVNGHADQLTQDAGVFETAGHCVTITNSSHVTIRHMRLHHSWTDGISVRAAFAGTRTACRHVVIENCEVYANGRCNIAVHETRHIRIADCRIYGSGMGIDIEPDLAIGTEYDVNIQPPGSSRFTVIENCEIFNNVKPLSVGVRYSHVRVQGCFIDNEYENQQPVILSVPHCALLDCEINTRSGYIDVAITGSLPGNNVFTMERCLIRSNTAMVNGVLTAGAGLFIAPDPTAEPPRIKQALIANNRFINESTHAWFPVDAEGPVDNGSRFPNLSHGDLMLQLIFRDNYVFIPSAAYHGQGGGMSAVGMHAHLAENNVYATDLGADGAFFQVLYGTGTPPAFGVLVRNERFLSGGAGQGFRPGDNTNHDNTYPYYQS